MKLVIASKNNNKIREIQNKFSNFNNIELLSYHDFVNPPDVVEDASTFEGNALKKARATTEFTGLPALSDDSGLEIDALNGEPGVYSARYGGDNATDEDKNLLVLEKMSTIPDKGRSARFRCVIAIVLSDGTEYIAEGTCEGRISKKMRGTEGFGYDPIFVVPALNKTMAEIDIGEKNKISHRAHALEKAREILAAILQN